MTLLSRPRRAARALARQPRGDRGRITLGEFVAFNAYLVMLGLADDRVRLGHEHAAARHGVVEADARGARRASRRSATPRVDATAPRVGIARRDRVPRPDVRLSADRPAGAATTSRCAIAGGQTRGARRRDRLGQVDADQPAAAAARSAAGHGVRRRRRRREIPLAALRGAIGFVPQEPFLFSRHDRRQRRLRRRAGAGGPRTRTRGRARRGARSRGSTRTSRTFRSGYDTIGGRARHHAVGRPEAAHGASRARVIDRSARS